MSTMKNSAKWLRGIAAACGLLLMQGGAAVADWNYRFHISNEQLLHLYPNAADPTMPSFYTGQSGFPQTLEDSILLYTKSSLKNDGIAYSKVSVTTKDNTRATITIRSKDRRVKGYGSKLSAFVKAGTLGWSASLACQAASGCWGNPVSGGQPWAYYLPLGLPLVNQKAVTLLDYPPNASLCTSDYLSNFTTARWDMVMRTAGVANPVLYEAIADAHPIAAPGTGQSTNIDATSPYYGGKCGYDNAMLKVLIKPKSKAATETLPVLVLGTPARTTWGQLIGYQGGQAVPVNSAGKATLPGETRHTKWVAGNHPNVTTYQCCPGDTNSRCGGSFNLVQDEIIDLTVACTIKKLAESPIVDPSTAQASCSTLWNSDAKKHAVCVQARIDYSFTSKGMPCKCQAAADAFCTANQDNACATDSSGVPLTCSNYDNLCDGTTPERTPPKYQYPGCASN